MGIHAPVITYSAVSENLYFSELHSSFSNYFSPQQGELNLSKFIKDIVSLLPVP